MNDVRLGGRWGTGVRIAILALAVLAGAGGPARADGPENITKAEWALLPEYCYYTQLSPGRDDATTTQLWYSRLGKGFHYLHHYCWGLVYQMRAERERLRGTKMNYNFLLRRSVGEMQYTLDRIEPNFRLRPEMLTRQGRVMVTAGRNDEAVKVFQMAREQAPAYWPASVGLGDVLLVLGRGEQARQVVDDALAQSPGVKQLTDLKAKIEKTGSVAARSPQAPAGTRPAVPGGQGAAGAQPPAATSAASERESAGADHKPAQAQ